MFVHYSKVFEIWSLKTTNSTSPSPLNGERAGVGPG
jgi:hypothetical protein